MSAPALLDSVRKSGLIRLPVLDRHLEASAGEMPEAVVEGLIEAGLLTRFQARLLREGKHQGFFLGDYKVLRPVGRGGMGVVYEAEHIRLHRRAAVKVLATSRAAEPGAVERFHREAQAAAALAHPNIVRVFDVGSAERCHYLVMEYIEGKSLDELLQVRGRLPWHEATALAVQAAHGLQHAHERGLVHRDIKPANLLLGRGGVVKILDMGLARFLDEDRNDGLTERLGARAIIGTPDFISPEQVRGQCDIRSDVYGLGATLYALIEGRPPFPFGEARDKFLAHQCQVPIPLDERLPWIPPGLSAAVVRMLAKRPSDRPQTPAEVIELLTPFTAPQAAPAPPRKGWLAWLFGW